MSDLSPARAMMERQTDFKAQIAKAQERRAALPPRSRPTAPAMARPRQVEGSKNVSERTIQDLERQIDKAIDVLKAVDRMMTAEADMNAAKHMSSRVMPNPLSASVATVIADLERSRGEDTT